MLLDVNTLSGLLFYIMVSFGLTFLIKDSTILHAPRTWIVGKSSFMDKLLSCSFCTGCWVGIALGAWVLFRQGLTFEALKYPRFVAVSIETIICSMAASATSAYILDTATQLLEARLSEPER